MSTGTGKSPPVVKPPEPAPSQRAGGLDGKGRHRGERRGLRRWLLVGGGVLLVLLAVATIDAYRYAASTVDDLRTVADELASAKNSLSKGQLPAGDPFAKAQATVRRIRAQLDSARPTFGLVGAIPFLGRPVVAVRKLTEASEQEAQAAVAARDLIDRMTGGALSSTRSSARTKCSEEPTKAEKRACKAARDQGTSAGGSELPQSPIFTGGHIDLAKLTTFEPELRRVVSSLRAAEASVQEVPTAPFIGKLTALKNDVLAEVSQARRAGESALLGMRVLPSLLGADGPRRYFIAFGDLSYIRGAGGSTLAYAILTADHGAIDISQSKQVFRNLDDQTDVQVPVPDDNWYLRTLKDQVRLGNANYSPNFPSSASVMAAIYEKLTGEHLDGVIQVDAPAVGHMLKATGPLSVPLWDEPIRSTDVSQISYIDSHLRYPKGPRRKDLSAQLVKAAWERIAQPENGLELLGSVVQLGRALAEKHLQVWLGRPTEQALGSRLGWTGAIRPAPADYLLVAEDEQSTDALAFFSQQEVDHRVVVRDDGSLLVTTTVTDSVTLPDQYRRRPIISKHGAKRVVLVNLYAPLEANLLSITHENAAGQRFRATLRYTNIEADRHVFSAVTHTPPDEASKLIFRYVVPQGLLQTPDGKAYDLTMQIQPTENPTTLNLTVELPDGMSFGEVPKPFQVDGNTLTLERTMERDGSIRIPVH
jgi:hypothetical protein